MSRSLFFTAAHFQLHWWPLAFLLLSPPLQYFHVVIPQKNLSRGGWQRGLEPSLHDRPSKEIRPSETEYKFSLKTNMAEDGEMEGR